MSLRYGIQSVIFYILSCSTCQEISHKRETKAKAKKDLKEKKELEMKQPGLYHHPSPFDTNPFWAEEIALGPNPPDKKKKSNSKTKLGEGEKAKTWDDVEEELEKRLSAKKVCEPGKPCKSTPSSLAPSSPTVVGTDSKAESVVEPVDDKLWNCRKGYQREDEELWGVTIRPGLSTIKAGHRIVRDAFTTAQHSVGSTLRGMEGFLPKFTDEKKDERHHPYFVSRNPPVNDLHPPVVSSGTWHKGGMRWMLQPPPSAKVMAGLARVDSDICNERNRSRSGSRASTVQPRTPSLSRQVTGRHVEQKLRRGEVPEDEGWAAVVARRESKITLASRKTTLSQTTLNQSTVFVNNGSQATLPGLSIHTPLSTLGHTRSSRSRGNSTSSTDSRFIVRTVPVPSSRANRRVSTDSIDCPPMRLTAEEWRAIGKHHEVREAREALQKASSPNLGLQRTRTDLATSDPRPGVALRRTRTDPLEEEPSPAIPPRALMRLQSRTIRGESRSSPVPEKPFIPRN